MHLKSRPHVKSVMTPFPYAIELQASLRDAEAQMAEHSIHHLPVVNGHELVGVVTQRDMLAAQARGDGAALVADVYIAEPYVVDLETALDEVLLGMAERHVGSVLVTRHGRLAGVFTVTDACRVFGEDLRERYPPLPDGDIVA